MKRLIAGAILFALTVLIAMQAGTQAQDKEGKDKKGPPRFELGAVLPPFIRMDIDLTEEQMTAIADLEKEVKAKLTKILTPEQLKKIESIRPPRPGKDNNKRDKGTPKPDP